MASPDVESVDLHPVTICLIVGHPSIAQRLDASSPFPPPNYTPRHAPLRALPRRSNHRPTRPRRAPAHRTHRPLLLRPSQGSPGLHRPALHSFPAHHHRPHCGRVSARRVRPRPTSGRTPGAALGAETLGPARPRPRAHALAQPHARPPRPAQRIGLAGAHCWLERPRSGAAPRPRPAHPRPAPPRKMAHPSRQRDRLGPRHRAAHRRRGQSAGSGLVRALQRVRRVRCAQLPPATSERMGRGTTLVAYRPQRLLLSPLARGSRVLALGRDDARPRRPRAADARRRGLVGARLPTPARGAGDCRLDAHRPRRVVPGFSLRRQ